MQLSSIVRNSIAAASLLLVHLSLAQTVPAVKTSMTNLPTTWSIFAGISAESQPTVSGSPWVYGFDGSVSQYPFKSHPWIGGTIDFAGHFSSMSGSLKTVGTQSDLSTYEVLGGPSFRARARRVTPFGRLMAGPVVDRTTASVKAGASVISESNYFAIAGGGGADFGISPDWAIRTQADWIRYWVKFSPGQDFFRTSGGLLFRF